MVGFAWLQLAGFLGGGIAAGALFLVLAWRAERRGPPDP